METNASSSADGAPCCWGMFRRRLCRVPTWRFWVMSGLLGCVGLGLATQAHRFLAVARPVPAEFLVAEGWLPDYGVREAHELFLQGRYRQMLTTGTSLERGDLLLPYRSYAAAARATLLRLGLSTNQLVAVPAPSVYRERTYASAVALRDWFLAQGQLPAALNVVSLGPHARRTRLQYERAFGTGVPVGVIAVANPNYDSRCWWRYSEGLRDVIGETLGYLQAKFLFRPDVERRGSAPGP